MKTVKTIFVLSAMTLTFSVNTFAAGVRAAEVRERLEKDVRRGGSLQVLKGATQATEITRMSQELSKLSNRRADEAALKEAIKRSIGYSEGEASVGKTIKLADVAKELLRLDEASKGIRESRLELTAEGKLQLEALESAVETATEFLALAGRTTDLYKKADQMTNGEKYMRSTFNKQLSILASLGSMNATDLKAHTEVMKAALKYQGPRVAGDVAFNKAMFYEVAKGNEAKYNERTAELNKCK